MENEILISTRGLKKHFPTGGGTFTALDNIDLEIGKGEFTGLVGPSGSGKTTLLNIIGTLDIPSEGEAIVLGRSVGDLSHREAAGLRNEHYGFIFQTYNLLPVYTVYENVEFPLLLLNTPPIERHNSVISALEWVGLSDKIDSKPALLSGGECQRVAIARAMVKKPKIVIADEPTANLDAKNSHHILQTMVRLNSDIGTSFIFATHDEKVIGYLQRIITLEDGRITDDRIIKKDTEGAVK